jgi:hypothetical protein
MRETARIATSEWPPTSKKLSRTPTSSRPKTSRHISTSLRSSPSRGAT